MFSSKMLWPSEIAGMATSFFLLNLTNFQTYFVLVAHAKHRTRAHKQLHTHVHTQTQMPARAHTDTHKHTHTHVHKHAHTKTYSTLCHLDTDRSEGAEVIWSSHCMKEVAVPLTQTKALSSASWKGLIFTQLNKKETPRWYGGLGTFPVFLCEHELI